MNYIAYNIKTTKKSTWLQITYHSVAVCCILSLAPIFTANSLELTGMRLGACGGKFGPWYFAGVGWWKPGNAIGLES